MGGSRKLLYQSYIVCVTFQELAHRVYDALGKVATFGTQLRHSLDALFLLQSCANDYCDLYASSHWHAGTASLHC